MYKYKRLLATINFTPVDHTVVHYANLVSQIAQSETVYLGYVEERSDIPRSLLEKHSELGQISEAHAREKMENLVREHFSDNTGAEVVYRIAKGSPLVEYLRQVQKDDIDLIVVGRQEYKKGGRMLPERLARKAPCSVLIVPEKSKPEIKNILVGVDFSQHSVNAFEEAMAFAAAIPDAVIHCLHAFRVPMEYYKTGISFAQFAADIEEHAQESYLELVGRYDLKGLDVQSLFVLDDQPSHAIRRAAKTCCADLIITGARGRSNTAAWVLGSVTEQLIWNSDIPILAVKKKGAGMSLLKALLNL